MLKIYFLIAALSGLVLFMPSCSKDGSECNISDSCYTEKIDSGDVIVRISYKQGQPGVPVTLYKGYAEDNDILWHDTVYQEEIALYVPVGQRYAAEAYYAGSKPLTALDGKKLKNNTRKECGVKCYDFPSVKLDCRKL